MPAPVLTRQDPQVQRLRPPTTGNTLFGLGLAIIGNAVFSVQDPAVKWLVADYTVWQVLFIRSLVITAIAVGLAWKTGRARVLASPNKPALVMRAMIMLVAWLLYYNAARSLTLPDLVTLYYASPLFITVLSIVVLGEQVNSARWVAVFVGFAGVVIAANPTGRPDLVPALLVLAAAFLWGLSNILMRRISASETTETQMLFTNSAYLIMCGTAMFYVWRPPSLLEFVLMAGIGISSGVGQYCVYESVRHAPASLVAPCTYTALLWSFLWGYVIWGDLPTGAVLVGAGLILSGSAIVVVAEWRRRRLGALAKPA
jgi:S-adenosylmethionine uptake transporter